jgi:hypothetical protein
MPLRALISAETRSRPFETRVHAERSVRDLPDDSSRWLAVNQRDTLNCIPFSLLQVGITRQDSGELHAGGDVELREYFAQVILDRAVAYV